MPPTMPAAAIAEGAVAGRLSARTWVSRQEAKWSSSSSRRCEGGGAGGAGVDDQRHRRVGLLGDEAEQLLEAEAEALAPALAVVGGRLEPLAQAGRGAVEGGQEAVFLVLEVLVEGRAGDAGAVEHVLDADLAVAELRRGPQHRRQQALALDGADQVGGKGADAGGELAFAAGEQLRRGADVGLRTSCRRARRAASLD